MGGVWEHDPIEYGCHDLHREIEENAKRFNVSGVYNETHYPDAFKTLVDLHVPKVTISDDHKTGTVTLAGHPMTADHYITDIFVVDHRHELIECHMFMAGDVATLTFNIHEHVEEITVLEHCNLHGVWEHAHVNVTALRLA